MKKEPVTLEKVATNVEEVASKVDSLASKVDSLTSTVTELAEATYNGFARVQETLATKADKTDIARLDKRIDKTDENIRYLRLKVDDVHEELRGFTSDVRDELSTRITVLEKKQV